MKLNFRFLSVFLTSAFLFSVYLPDNSLAGASYQGVDYSLIREGEYGEAFFKNAPIKNLEILIITNESGLSEKSIPAEEWIISLEECTIQEVNWKNKDFLFSAYGENIRMYKMTCFYPYAEEASVLCRKLYLENAAVLDTMWLNSNSGTVVWNGKFIFHVTDEFQDENKIDEVTEQIDNCAVLNNLEEIYKNWEFKFEVWKNTVNTSEMTAKELAESKKSNLIYSDYEITMLAYSISEKVPSMYPDMITEVIPELSYIDSESAVYTAVSTWKNIGDLNEDKKINALDAAKILTASAMNGAGNDTGLSIEEQQFADVNADGIFNAVDASLILQYSASIGCGDFNGTLAEFLKSAE